MASHLHVKPLIFRGVQKKILAKMKNFSCIASCPKMAILKCQLETNFFWRKNFLYALILNFLK